ncbi:aspartate/glutamate racemase family protein [Bacteroidota bacterium]
MRILIINPNSSLKMTESIHKAATEYANGDFEVICKPVRDAPEFIDNYMDKTITAPGMIKLVKENEEKFDAFIIACHCDPNMDVIKEITNKPVVGIGEASMRMAAMLGHSFSVISASKHSVPNKEALIRKYHLQDLCASVKAPADERFSGNKDDLYIQLAEESIKDDMAEVIVLGCAGMAGLDKKIQNKLGVPVLDGVICALIIAYGLVKYGVSTSKARRYAV